MTCTVKRVEDFEVDGSGGASAWERTSWLEIGPMDGPSTYATRVKVLYSQSGLYCFFDGVDETITSTALKDGDDLWTEDVFEVFLWPDESQLLYLEFEISPMNADLVLLVPHCKGGFIGWQPWHYDATRQVRKATAVRGGEKKPGGQVTGWSAEFFIPFSLMRGMHNVPPSRGTRWRGNFFRIDHDRGAQTLFAWSRTRGGFHDPEKFGTLIFE